MVSLPILYGWASEASSMGSFPSYSGICIATQTCKLLGNRLWNPLFQNLWFGILVSVLTPRECLEENVFLVWV